MTERIVSVREILKEAKRLKLNYELMWLALREIATLEHYEECHQGEMEVEEYVRLMSAMCLETVDGEGGADH